jgi:hypothetical protein
MASVTDIPIAHTPVGGYGTSMPPPILAGCDDDLADGAPDLRGLWRIVDVRTDAGGPLPPDNPMWHHHERIEQAGSRVVVTAGGVIHDMYADGTLGGGVHDVMALDFTTPINVTASFETGRLVLRPEEAPGMEISRWRDGEHLMWRYDVMFTARLERA